MENSVSQWFSSEVLYWRYVSTIFWTIIIQLTIIPVVTLFTVFIFNAQDGLQLAVTQYLISIVFTILFAWMHINNFTVVPKNAISVLEVGKMWLSPKRWLPVTIFTVLSTFSVKCLGNLFARFTLYEESIMCATASVNCCLSEKHVFNMLHGAFVGVIFGYSYFSNGWYSLEFPTIEQLKFPTSKTKIKEVTVHSAITVFKHIKWFYLLYYLFGNLSKSLVNAVTDHPFCNRIPLTSVHGLLDLHLLWVTWMSAVVLHIIWSSFLALFPIFMTEHYLFEIETVLEKDAHKTLTSALQCTNLPILQYLACHDFSHLSRHSATRRSKIFQISNPGGHPVQWNTICGESLKLVDQFLQELIDISSGPASEVPVTNVGNAETESRKLPQKSPKTPTREALIIEKEKELSDSFSTPNTRSFSTPNAYRRPFLKNLASPSRILFDETIVDHRPQVYPNVDPIGISDWFSAKVAQLIAKIKSHPFVKYFIMETTEAKLDRLFLRSQPVIWSIQGMCFMVRASFHEDKYGVVQRWLPDIITKFLELQTALDRSQKTLTKKQNLAKRGSQLRQTLRVVLNTGLYYIVYTFKHHLRNINLTAEHRQRLLQYENFMA